MTTGIPGYMAFGFTIELQEVAALRARIQESEVKILTKTTF